MHLTTNEPQSQLTLRYSFSLIIFITTIIIYITYVTPKIFYVRKINIGIAEPIGMFKPDVNANILENSKVSKARQRESKEEEEGLQDRNLEMSLDDFKSW